jgi:hypothetical protein
LAEIQRKSSFPKEDSMKNGKKKGKNGKKPPRCLVCLRRGNGSSTPLCKEHEGLYIWDKEQGYLRRRKRGGPGLPNKWKKIWPSQGKLQRILEGSLGLKVDHEVGFLDLLSPKGALLRWDMCIPSLKVLVEFDGEQHKKHILFFFKKKKDWKYYLECQEIKRRWAEDAGWTIIRFSHEDLPFREGEVKSRMGL